MSIDNMKNERHVTLLALFTSLSTLVCCALPIILVSLGLGATYAAITDTIPLLITLGKYKAVTFTLAGILISASLWFTFRPGRACPSDPQLAQHCSRIQIWNKRLLILAATAWCIGFFAAYLALPLQLWLEG
ncbi:MAG: hypothetical protein OEZ39_19990 [Gammaproteobacteria bacterium]|nr:hypothetical protein [Gammaproteobacteria bacterium]MDH5654150.1 hypothetical protein [Gammaproteobacteria bacterium]